jgi:hypothetical protein
MGDTIVKLPVMRQLFGDEGYECAQTVAMRGENCGHGGRLLEKVVEWNLVEVFERGETLGGLLEGFCFLE